MDPFSYLSVLISIVLALGMTRVLAGIGEMLHARSRGKVYWIHALWVFNLFLFLVIAWWVFYRWRNYPAWTYYLFLFVLVSPTILYLAAVVLFPPEHRSQGFVDYRTHYYANHRAFFALFALWVPVDVIDTLLKGTAHFWQLGTPYLFSALVLTALLTTAAVIKNEKFHAFAAIYFFIHTVIVSFFFFPTLV